MILSSSNRILNQIPFGAFILAEAAERVPEIADLLGIKLLIMKFRINPDEFELFCGDFRNIILIHHFLLPILILGSMIP